MGKIQYEDFEYDGPDEPGIGGISCSSNAHTAKRISYINLARLKHRCDVEGSISAHAAFASDLNKYQDRYGHNPFE